HLLYPSLLSHPPAPPRSLPSSPTRRSSDLLMRRQGLAEFPDAVTARGAKHLDELAAMVAAGCRAVMLFLIQIGSAERFTLAADRSEEHTSELQSLTNLVCRLLLGKKKHTRR